MRSPSVPHPSTHAVSIADKIARNPSETSWSSRSANVTETSNLLREVKTCNIRAIADPKHDPGTWKTVVGHV